MELALFLSEPGELRQLAQPIDGLQIDRLYFGNEFCERLLMLEAHLDTAIAAAQQHGCALTIVLPYLSPSPLERAKRLLARLAAAAPGTEVVCNDWGVLRHVALQAELQPVMGRCLNRTLCDPRLPEHVGGALPAGALAAFRGSAFTSAPFGRFADKYRVRRIELDQPPLGLDPSPMPEGLAASVHHPYAFVASGRICLFAAVHRHDHATVGERFTPGPCQYECRDYELTLSAPTALAGRLPLLQRGNTVFVAHDPPESIGALMTAMGQHADRLVWSAAAPMGGGPCAA